jgi:hypothetical protein
MIHLGYDDIITQATEKIRTENKKPPPGVKPTGVYNIMF